MLLHQRLTRTTLFHSHVYAVRSTTTTSIMVSAIERCTRFGLNAASTATSVGFAAAKTGTRFGVRILLFFALED